MSEMVRTHVLLPRELVARIDAVVGPRRRSEFVAETLRRELDRRRLLDAMDAAIEEARNAPPDTDPPEWDSAESAVAWVRAQRAISTDPWESRPDG